MKNERGFVYVLKLQGGNWYVGSTNNVESRMCEHFNGNGSLWTQRWPPCSVTEVIECPTGDPLPLERSKTAQLAMQFGWQKVMGSTVLPQWHTWLPWY